MRPSSPRTGSSASSCFWARWWTACYETRSAEVGARNSRAISYSRGSAFRLPGSAFSRSAAPASTSEAFAYTEPQRPLGGRLVSQSGKIQQEFVFKRHLAPTFVTSRRATVSGFHVRPQDEALTG